ncbi:MAG TPA: AAA family ATPase [Thermoplasmata archaeon]|nr:AAA family ATPase [Thermoplasmata archaeon]
MMPLVHPEVLARDWLPPVLLDRAREVETVRRRIQDALVPGGPRGVLVVGPSGSGTSSVARLAARTVVQEIRRTRPEPAPLLACLRSDARRPTQGIATGLLQTLEPGFTGSGFHTTEILAGFLRRLRRQDRPAVVVLDDIGPGTSDLRPILRAFASPDSFLPEGESGLPPLALVLAGTPDARAAWTEAGRRGWATGQRISLAAYAPATIERIVRDRATRAISRVPPEAWSQRLMERVRDLPANASIALEALAHELIDSEHPRERGIFTDVDFRAAALERPLLAALARASAQRHATVAELRRWEAEYAHQQGARPLAATTFWRRIVRLESVGVVHREVRAGGAGGTRSVIELLRPIKVPENPASPGTPPAAGWSAVPSGPVPERWIPS